MGNLNTHVLDRITVGALDVKYARSTINSRTKTLGGGKRGKVTELSRQSRTRLLHKTRNIPDLKRLITFTYPAAEWSDTATGGDFMRDGLAVKQHLRKLRQALSYRGLYGVWFLEFQKRGAPHFHFFCGGDITDSQVEKLRKTWYRMVGTQCPHHLQRGVDVQILRKQHAAGAYAAKYTTKDEQKIVPKRYHSVGRFWGYFGDIPTETVEASLLSPKEFYDITRVARRWAKAESRAKGFRPRLNRGKGLTGQIFWNCGPVIHAYVKSLYTVGENPSEIDFRLRRTHNSGWEPPS